MLDDESGNPPGAVPVSPGKDTEADVSKPSDIDAALDDGSDGGRDVRGLVDVGLNAGDEPDSEDRDSLSVDFGDIFDDDNDVLPPVDADAHELGNGASSGDLGELGVDLSPWPPLLGLLDSTEPEESPVDGPFTPTEGVEGAHALELRAESMLFYSERGAQRAGTLDRTEVGFCDDNRDVVAGRDEVEVYETLEEHTGRGLVVVADELETNVTGPVRVESRLEDNIIMAGVMKDEWAGGTLIAAAMSDDMAAGVGLRCTAPLDLWAHRLVGKEERPGTCAADGLLFELAAAIYEREYVSSVHGAVVARFQGTTATTMRSGFRPLMETAIGVRNLVPGGGGGGGDAGASPPAAPPDPGGSGGGEAAGGATLGAVESGGTLGRGVAGSGDTDEIASVVRTVETASDTAEDLEHPASTADNLDDLARVDVEGEGYQQVAEIYEQPIPASAAPETDSAPVPGTGSAATDRAPPLYQTEPRGEGYNFADAYRSLHDRNQFYRADSNWRGNIYMREYLSDLDAAAAQLLTNLGGSTEEIAGDNYGHRTAHIYATMQTMLEKAEQAGRLDDVVEIRTAMDQLEALVNTTIADVATQSAEFSGAALGSQRVPIDAGIDTEKLRTWLNEQLLRTQDMFAEAEQLADPVAKQKAVQDASWEAAYWIQLIKALDEGINPLADSSEQIALIRVEKVDPYLAQFAGDIADAEQLGYVFVPPRTADQEQLDLFIQLQEQLAETLSNPEFFRSADDMGGDAVTGVAHGPMEPGPDLAGSDSAHSLGGVDEPDVGPVLGGDEPPPTPPDDLVADSPAGVDSAAPGGATTRREPDPLYSTQPGTEGYDFEDAYRSLHKRNQYYREEFLFGGNFYTRECLKETDAQAWRLFENLEGPAGSISGDNFGRETSSIYRTLQTMATEADEAGDASRAAEIRAAIAELEGIVAGKLSEVASRVDEFAGRPIDAAVDTEKLRVWLQDQMSHAEAMQMAAETDEARQRATWEWGYYLVLLQTLDAGGDPLAVSNEQIAVLSIYGTQDAASSSSVADEVALYINLQDGLLATLADPEFHRSTPALGAAAFTPGAHRPVEAGLDLLGTDSLRPFAGGEPPLPLPAADVTDSAVYVDEVRDRSFSRSALAASEETLERQAVGRAEGGASVPGSARVPDSTPPESSFGTRLASPDSAQAPIVDELSGQWVVEPPAEPGAPPASARGDATPAPVSDVSWESGLQVTGDSEVGTATGRADDLDGSDLFKAASEPEDVDSQAADEMRHSPGTNDDGTSGSPTTLSDSSGGEDMNPSGTVSEPDDSTTASGPVDEAGAGRSSTMSPVAPDTLDPVPADAPRNPPGTDAMPPGATAGDSDPVAAGTGSDLYGEPVSFEGRSLGGASPYDDSKELGRPIDGAEIQVEDLPRVEPVAAEPGRKPILKNLDGRPVSDTYADVDELEIQRRLAQAGYNKRVFNDSTVDAGSAWRGALWSGDRMDVAALREANARWSEITAAERTSTVSFSDDARQLLYHVEYERTVKRRGNNVDLFRGVDPPNTLDRAHASHYVPRPPGWETTRETGFGRVSQGWNEFPFSPRERIVNSLQKGEALSPDQIISLELSLESYRAAGGELSSSQYRAMVDMISDLGDEYRHARWSMHGEGGQRLLQLIEMLDYAAEAV